MGITVNWPRFLVASIVAALFVIVIAIAWHGHYAASMYATFPARQLIRFNF